MIKLYYIFKLVNVNVRFLLLYGTYAWVHELMNLIISCNICCDIDIEIHY